jgi:hypothetical protein
MSDFLSTHKLDVLDIVFGDTSFGEFLLGEPVSTVVEKIKLDPFLVQSQVERLEID